MVLKAVAALSGGVDSSVAAMMLMERGFSVTGATLILHDECGRKGARSCCAYEDILAAKDVAAILGLPHFVLDRRELFDSTVKKPFLDAMRAGSTPNPCVGCNETMKFGFLLDWAIGNGAELLATGHYARIEFENGIPVLMRGADLSKDQSYFLFAVSEDRLARSVFPLGEMTKREVREKAKAGGLPTSEKPESQDVCFGSGSGLAEFLLQSGFRERGGPVVLDDGTEVGKHSGLWKFTVGQRKGIRVPYGEPLYVIRKDRKRNALVVGPKEKALKRRFKVSGWLWRSGRRSGIIDLQVRYRQTPRKARIVEEGGCVFAEWLDEMEVAAPGQAAVAYAGDRVAGGGWIAEEEPYD